MMAVQLTRTVKILLALNLGIFIVQQTADRFFDAGFLHLFALTPSLFVVKLHIWQIFTYAFLHGDVMHLFLNLLMLAFIGGELDRLWGSRPFLRYYFVCSTFAGLLYLFFQVFVTDGLHVPMVGASGAIYGLLMAYGILFGERTLLFMLLFPMKAKHFIWVLAGVEFMTSLFSPHGGLSSVAHLGGMGAGLVFLWARARMSILSKSRKRASTSRSGRGLRGLKLKKKNNSHLKLVVSNPSEKFEDEDDPKTWH